MIEFELTFDGGVAEEGLLEFYDAAKALSGFQRSLALTTHLALHGEIITQAPYAKGFQIFVPPFYEGSWKAKAKIAVGTAIALGSVGKDSPVGHVVTSLYSAALSTTMGFDVDYDKTLQELYYENHKDRPVTVEKIDSLCEKIESSVADMHRPIVISESAARASIQRCDYYKVDVGPILSPLTYEYVKQTTKDEDITTVVGHVSSYNINTNQGRIYCLEQKRPIPFLIDESIRSKRTTGILTRSQHNNGQSPFSSESLVRFRCHKMLSAAGKVKRYLVVSVENT